MILNFHLPSLLLALQILTKEKFYLFNLSNLLKDIQSKIQCIYQFEDMFLKNTFDIEPNTSVF